MSARVPIGAVPAVGAALEAVTVLAVPGAAEAPATSHPSPIITSAAAATSEPWARVAVMGRALDFYLGLGCEVRQATDGWVLLGCGGVSFVLIAATEPASDSGSRRELETVGDLRWARLTSPDVRALRRRLLADGIPTSALLRPHGHSFGEIHVVDPDGRTVVVEQPGPAGRTSARSAPGPRP